MVMDVEKIFHMSEGVGKTSYSTNSSLQKKAAEKVKHITLEAIKQVYLDTKPKSIGIADLGCSSGPNTLLNLKDIVQSIEGICRETPHPVPEFRLFLNDLPSNDFNIIFRALPDFLRKLRDGRNEGAPAVYVGAYPGSFYGRLFPDRSLHLVYSSYSLHWLSKVPPDLYDENGESINKGSIYIGKESPPQVARAYCCQFEQDFSLFLGSRSEEIISGGQMVLILLGREQGLHAGGNSFYWDILTQSFSHLVAKGVVKEEKLDSYDVHFYAPSKVEIEECIEKEKSFKLEKVENFDVEKDSSSYGSKVAMAVRAIQESMISHHFGEEILDDLFHIFARLVDEQIAKEEDIINPITFVVLLKKF